MRGLWLDPGGVEAAPKTLGNKKPESTHQPQAYGIYSAEDVASTHIDTNARSIRTKDNATSPGSVGGSLFRTFGLTWGGSSGPPNTEKQPLVSRKVPVLGLWLDRGFSGPPR